MKLIGEFMIFALLWNQSFLSPVNRIFLTVKEKEFYFSVILKANFFAAAHYCKYHGMELASVETKEENDAIVNHIENSGYKKEIFWISGNDLGEEGKFFWLATGKPFQYTNWHVNEPNNGGKLGPENCVLYWNPNGKGYHWNDGTCLTKAYFVCEKKTSFIDVRSN